MIVIDMELPKTCRSCNLSFDAYGSITEGKCAGLRFGVTYMNDRRNPICPIVGEIPDNHGDLKDTADIIQRYEHEMVKLKAELPKEQYEQIFRVFHVFIKPWIDQAPIILEATK